MPLYTPMPLFCLLFCLLFLLFRTPDRCVAVHCGELFFLFLFFSLSLFFLRWLGHRPFSELPASAGELLHDSLADSNLHGHRPAISSRQHPLLGSDMSQHSDPVSALSDHPASPVLLTRNGPRGAMNRSQCHLYIHLEHFVFAVLAFGHFPCCFFFLLFFSFFSLFFPVHALLSSGFPERLRKTESHTRDGYWFSLRHHASSQFEDRSRRIIRYPQTCGRAHYGPERTIPRASFVFFGSPPPPLDKSRPVQVAPLNDPPDRRRK